MKMFYFGKDIEPSCEYCIYYDTSENGTLHSCRKKQTLVLTGSCKRFEYDPLKRKPKRILTLPQYSAEDFKL